MRGNEGYESISEGKQIEEDGKRKKKKLLMYHLILSVSPASVDHLQTSLLLPHQLVREVQYGIVCLFKDVPPELMDNNQLLRVSNHCKNFVQIRSIQSPTATIG